MLRTLRPAGLSALAARATGGRSKYRKAWVTAALTFLIVGATSVSTAEASAVLQFTDSISFNYTGGTGNISDLAATATFTASGGTLTIVVQNLSSTAEIADIFFNTSSPTTITFGSVTSSPNQAGLTASISANQQADGFGTFSWDLQFGSSSAARLNTLTTATVTTTYTGTLSDADFAAFSVQGGQQTPTTIQGAIDWKPLQGLTGFGSGHIQEPNPVPEPATALAAALGLVPIGLVMLRKRLRRVA